jgi:hypothetical protein
MAIKDGSPCCGWNINGFVKTQGNIQVTSIVKNAGGCDTLTFNWMLNNLKAMLVKQKNVA